MGHKHLTADQRSQIYALLSKNFSQKEIARHLRVDKSCISREINQNSGLKGYRPKQNVFYHCMSKASGIYNTIAV